MEKIRELFQYSQDSMVWSCLDGSMGKSVYLNDSAQITLGDFCFLAGKPNREILKTIEVPIITPDDEAWQQLIEEEFPDAKRALRYATKKEYSPNIEKLRELAFSLPEGYHIERIDESNIPLLCEDWSRDFISLFENEEDYLKRGRGFIAMHRGKPVSGASSYSVYHGGIEIEVDTKSEHRRKGLASACSARLILSCIEDGLLPCWDAQNLMSLSLAEKLGYVFSHEYPVWVR